jgi:DNA-binding transcriptional MerR regulator
VESESENASASASTMRSIGELARDSGLTVSALRFYDGAGVLTPDRVDPVSGYRWYAPGQLADARLLARLRRVQLPLADVRLILAGWSSEDPALVRTLLEAHLRRLEDGLADARRELSAVRALLALRENPMDPITGTTATTRLTLAAAELAAALDSVRFAVSTDPELPMLGGVLFDLESGSLRTVATDRYRMALSGAAATGFEGPAVQVIVPAALVDAMRALLRDRAGESAGLTVEGDRIALEVGGSQAAGARLDFDFPDYRRLTRLPAGRRVRVDAAALREAVATGATRSARRGQDDTEFAVSVLAVDSSGSIAVAAEGEPAPAADTLQIGVNGAFLLDALAAAGEDQLVLELGGPIAPLAIRHPGADREATFSLLMPVRLSS